METWSEIIQSWKKIMFSFEFELYGSLTGDSVVFPGWLRHCYVFNITFLQPLKSYCKNPISLNSMNKFWMKFCRLATSKRQFTCGKGCPIFQDQFLAVSIADVYVYSTFLLWLYCERYSNSLLLKLCKLQDLAFKLNESWWSGFNSIQKVRVRCYSNAFNNI